MLEFARTRMGQRFFESTVPKLADELARLNTNLEALIATLQTTSTPLAPSGAPGGSDSEALTRSLR